MFRPRDGAEAIAEDNPEILALSTKLWYIRVGAPSDEQKHINQPRRAPHQFR